MNVLNSSAKMKVGFNLFFFLLIFQTQAQITSDFTSNNDGWTIFNNSSGSSSAASYFNTGGNPTGFITDGGIVTAAILYAEAPAKFRGNLSASYNRNLTFDLKQSTNGTDNTYGDVILTNSVAGISLYYQLPIKPASASFSSYAVQLIETNWHDGSLGAAAPDQTRMKLALSNITSIRIRTKYTTSNTFTVTGSLDNVVLNTLALGTPPTITSFTPSSALAGTTVTIIGTNFNTTPSQNIVYFKGIKAAVTSATATQLTVKVPTSAVYGALTVANISTGLQATSIQSFNPLFDNNKDFGGRIIPASMSRGYSTILPMSSTGFNSGGIDKGDLDGDGWIDLVVSETNSGTPKIYAYQNLGTGGVVSTSSFSAAITLPSLSTVPGGLPFLADVMIADVDSDGKLDVVASSAGNLNSGTGFLTVFRNTSTVGVISFASPVYFAYPYYNPLIMAGDDLDGDGRIDFMFVTGSSGSRVWVNQNLSTPGNIDFAYGISIGISSSYGDLTTGDLNGDGKPEIITSNYSAGTLNIFPNTSTPGTISMNTQFTIPSPLTNAKIAVGDLNADSKADIVWSGYNSQYVYLSQNNYVFGNPTFDATSFGTTVQIANTLSSPTGVNIGDINSDGKPDVVMVGYSDVGILQNLGSATLSASSFLPTTVFQGSSLGSALYGVGPTIADLDGDNKPEVMFAYTNNAAVAEKGIFIYHNESFPLPTIISTAPASAAANSSVAINGTLMSTGSTNPIVRLGKLKTALSGSPTNTITTVVTPQSSISGKFSLTNHGLTSNGTNFNSSFNTSRTINNSSFGPTIDFALTNAGVYSNLETADFDDDQKTDLVFRDGNGTGIFQNNAAAGQPITITSLTKQATVYVGGFNSFCFDFDGDGKTDLNNANYLYQNTSSGSTISFASSVLTSANSFTGSAYADFNKDGKVDVALIDASTTIKILENRTSRGTFIPLGGGLSSFTSNSINLTLPSNSANNSGIVTADFDGDGYDDVAATSPSTDNFSIFRNLAVVGTISASSFSAATSIATASKPYGITASDFDGDGKIDVAITHYSATTMNVYLNTSSVGSISFAAAKTFSVATFGFGIGSQDLDGDGKAEIVTIHNSNPGTPSFTIFQNISTAGNISFGAGINYTLSRYPLALAFADINTDQKPDILLIGVSGSSAPASALMVFENKISTVTLSITTQPTSTYSVCDGAIPIISTAAAGTTNITYQWQFSTTSSGSYSDLTNSGGYSTVATSGLTINSTGNFGAGFYRCKINGDFVSTLYSNTVSFTVNALPSAPVASNVSNCGSTSFTLTASGAVNGNYYWYDINGLIVGQKNNSYATPVLSATASYDIALTDGTCISPKINISAIINTIPTAPTTTNATLCAAGSATLTAAGGSNGQYRWYAIASGGTAITGEVNSTYITPPLAATTSYFVSINNGTCESTRTIVTATFSLVTPPTTTNATLCAAGSATLTAAGGSNGQYRWYAVASGGTAIAGEVNSTYITPSLAATTSYFVSINNGTCESTRTVATTTINAAPAKPTITSTPAAVNGLVTLCSGSSATLGVATSTTYAWSSAQATQQISVTQAGTFTVVVKNAAGCASPSSDAITVVVNTCTNEPPTLATSSLIAEVGGKTSLSIPTLIGKISNADLTTLKITKQPSSGAKASIDANFNLILDYAGLNFIGQEQLTIQVCNFSGSCVDQIISVDVGTVIAFNGISANGDSKNAILLLKYIDVLQDTKRNHVSIYNRWGDAVFEVDDYDNTKHVFTGQNNSGADLPSGTYFYKIDYFTGRKTQTGYLSLKR